MPLPWLLLLSGYPRAADLTPLMHEHCGGTCITCLNLCAGYVKSAALGHPLNDNLCAYAKEDAHCTVTLGLHFSIIHVIIVLFLLCSWYNNYECDLRRQ